MHIVFIHNSFPGHFGALAAKLIELRGDSCSFLAHVDGDTEVRGIRVIGANTNPEKDAGTGRDQDPVPALTDLRQRVRTAVDFVKPLQALEAEKHIDLLVIHSDWASAATVRRYLPNIPIVVYLEQYGTPGNQAIDFRAGSDAVPVGMRVMEDVRNMARLYDFLEMDAGWLPSHFTRKCLPEPAQGDLCVLTQHEGVDSAFWSPMSPEEISTLKLPDAVYQAKKLVTYVNRGYEYAKGFDIMMQAAKIIYETDPDVHFVMVGRDQTYYATQINPNMRQLSFFEWTLEQENYDLSRFTFIDGVSPRQLCGLFTLSRCHVYLSVPFVTGWSVINAMSCGTPVVASETGAVPEFVRHGHNGALVPMTDWKIIAEEVLGVLNSPRYEELARNARETIVSKYDFAVTVPVIGSFFDSVVGGKIRPYPRQTS